jgi:diguanylate cyclase (GGDEF)-like protein
LTADRLIRSVRDGDVVGRLGGDEFLVVCPDVTTPAIALALGERIGKSLAQTATLGGTTVVPGSSIGVAWTNGVVACDELVAWADEAMYTSKRDASGPVLAAR